MNNAKMRAQSGMPNRGTSKFNLVASGVKASLLCALLALVGAVSPGMAGEPANKEVAGVYTLVTLHGKKVPATISHQGANLEIHSGSFTINADGTCGSKMTFVPPGGKEVTLERKATYTLEAKKLTMQWEGAGRTTGTIKTNTFTMENEGMVLVYTKK